MGIIAVSESAIAMDLTICKMIGFSEEKIPLIRSLLKGEANYLFGEIDPAKIIIASNEISAPEILSRIKFPESWHYRPHDTWKSIKS